MWLVKLPIYIAYVNYSGDYCAESFSTDGGPDDSFEVKIPICSNKSKPLLHIALADHSQGTCVFAMVVHTDMSAHTGY